jgi:NAD(P)-dependent dehydrogenase (short-subunit alcohol dehydrogenase family)
MADLNDTELNVLAKELGAYNITVNTLAPGGTESGAAFQRAKDAPVSSRTLVYLLSSDSDFMTGQMMVINGGIAF